MVVMFISVLSAVSVSAVDAHIEYARINGEIIDFTNNNELSLEVERGEELDIRVKVVADADVENFQVMGDIVGYRYSNDEHSKVHDASKTYDLTENDTKFVDLNLDVPIFMDKKYTLLRFTLADENSQSFTRDIQLHVTGIDEDDAIRIDDWEFSPSNEIMAGRAFTALVNVENIGDDDLDDIKVTVRIPSLGVQDSEFLDELEADEDETFEELLLRVPDCTEPGLYDVEIEVEFDRFNSVTASDTITVVENELCGLEEEEEEEEEENNHEDLEDSRTVISVPGSQTVTVGTGGVTYPVVISNEGKTAKTYTLTVEGAASWATTRLDPGSQVVVGSHDTETVFLYVTPLDDAEAGQKVFTVTLESGDEKKEIPLTADVVAAPSGDGTSGGLVRGLQVALIVLVIILIILGLVVGFNKMKDSDDEDDENQTYY
ncbi:hypothetical protein CMO92_02850 [Candidatus Woesearchaeota archaeon]|nr:hypothetical protein [Candidatus Woesearchaeota archaeon]